MADTNISNIDIKTNLHYWIQQKIHPSSSHPPTFGFPASVSWSASLTLAWDRKRCKDPDYSESLSLQVSEPMQKKHAELMLNQSESYMLYTKKHLPKVAPITSNPFSSPMPLAVPDLYWPVRICSCKLYEIVTSKYLTLLSLQILTYLYVPLSSHSSVIQGNPVPLP